MIKEVPIIQIEKDHKIYYGGTQDWFDTEWGRNAGCASVLASNLACFYLDENDKSYEDYKELMNTMFSINKPGILGFPYFNKFINNFIQYMEDHNIHMDVINKRYDSIEDGFNFVKECIDDNRPIGLLILTHKAKILEDETWHWMCITGYDDEKHEVIYSSFGKRLTISADILFDVSTCNILKMMSFVKGE